MNSIQTDILIIGAGVAGLAAAAALARHRRVLVVERESQPAYHTSGRSAAMYIEAFENPTVNRLTRASFGYLNDPPGGADSLLSPRGLVMVADEACANRVEEHLRIWGPRVPGLQRVDAAQVAQLAPVVRPEWQVNACFDDSVQGIDVHGLLQIFQHELRAHGGELHCDRTVVALRRAADHWQVTLADAPGHTSTVLAPLLVNAAGAWGGQIGDLAGAMAVPLEPRRRTALLVDPPAGSASSDWPMIYAGSGDLYCKPEAGQLMVSPADEIPDEPCDVRPDELDIAVTADRLQQITTIDVRRIAHTWAGLRTFCPDRRHCAGFDRQAEGFFWLVGQGGCGVQTSPAMGDLTRGLIIDGAVPDRLREFDLAAEQFAPERFF